MKTGDPIDKIAFKGHETVLLVDDEPYLLETGQELLAYFGYHVLTASSGENALITIKQEGERIDIVILDLMMPGMGGEKCLLEIIKIFPAMKVVITSGNATGERIEEILRAGAAAFIQKPYRIEELIKTIRGILPAP